MSDPINPELFAQIQKLLDPSGKLSVPLPPRKEDNKEYHLPYQAPHREKKAAVGEFLKKIVPEGSAIGKHLAKYDHHYDLAGLGILAAPSANELGHQAMKEKGTRDKGEIFKSTAELGGLATLAAPVAAAARGFKHASAILDELEKVGFVSDAEASSALDSLNSLQQDKPTKRQTLGYMGAGAAIAPVVHMGANLIRKKPLLEGTTGGDKARDAAAQMFRGGLGGTAVSMAQHHIDRHDKTNTLKAYLAQHEAQSMDPDLQKAGSAKKKEEEKPQNLKKFLGGTAAGMGLTGANHLLGQHLQGTIDKPDIPLYERVKAKAPEGLNIHEGPHDDLRGAGPHFLAGRDTPFRAHLPDSMSKALDVDPYVHTGGSMNPSILAHELGHADIHKNRFGKLLQNPGTITAGSVAPGVGGLTGAASGFSDNKRVQQAGIAAPALLSLPQLAFEAGASIQGMRRMHGAGANQAQMLQGLKALAPAFGTYATRAGTGVANAYQAQGMVGGIRGMLHKKDGKKKEAGAPRLVGPKMPGLAGSGTPSMPMPKPQAVGIGVG